MDLDWFLIGFLRKVYTRVYESPKLLATLEASTGVYRYSFFPISDWNNLLIKLTLKQFKES